MMEREGKVLKVLDKGHRRRLSDGRNAWRKMTTDQRDEFLRWIADENDHPLALHIRQYFEGVSK